MASEKARRIEEIAVKLTEQISVVDTKDEIPMVEKLYEIMAGMEYFLKNPDDLKYVHSVTDPLGRKSVLATVRGKKGNSNKTVVLLGHTDTVGISDYGVLEPLAVKPYELTEKFSSIADQLPPEAREDLQSGGWLFGRGLFDMKTGDAINMQILDELSQDIDNLEGNVMFAAVCDEESGSCGMLSVVSELVKMREKHGFEYLALIDTDYMTSEYPGDENKYIYIGTVGKLLPTFYVVGKETHVGESYKGLDPNQIAGAITGRINLNPEFCDVVEGEVTLPPVTLRQRDLKKEYSVQIAKTAVVYMNYATHCSTPDQVMAKLKNAAAEAFQGVIDDLCARYSKFNEMAKRPQGTLPWVARVMSYEELYKKVKAEKGDELDKMIAALCEKLNADPGLDGREKSIKIVEMVHDQWSDRDPVVIVFFAPPYYPHIYVEGKTDGDRRLLDAVKKTVAESKTRYKIVGKKFYPYISDLSFASAPGDPKILDSLRDNLPGFGTTYLLPLDDMQKLGLPVCNIGPFGKDAHKWTERLEKRHAFEVTPELVLSTVLNLLK